MDYEKKYKEALERAREIIKDSEIRGFKDNLFYTKEDFEAIFPELNESEDEKIRKELISFLQLPHPQFVGERKQEKWIAWLEKQEPIAVNWSTDDKKKLLIIEQILNCANLLISSQELTEIKNWLKSLKQRIGR